MSDPQPEPEPVLVPLPDALARPGAAPRASVLAGLVRTARPRQWIKNLLVFLAPAAAGVLTRAHVLARAAGAFGLFCLVASAAYCLNDAADAESDRAHPEKRRRPVAQGLVSRRLAAGTGAALLPLAIAAGALLLGWRFALVLTLYVLISGAYTLWLKNEVVLDIAAVASGFLVRAIAGGVAVGVPLSDWFLIVTAFGSLFVVAGKREADLGYSALRLPGFRGAPGYTRQYLRSVRTLSAGVAVTSYCLWAFAGASRAGQRELLFELSIVPFVLAILRYALLIEAGQGGAPEEVVLGDRYLLGLGAAWGLLFVLAIYAF